MIYYTLLTLLVPSTCNSITRFHTHVHLVRKITISEIWKNIPHLAYTKIMHAEYLGCNKTTIPPKCRTAIILVLIERLAQCDFELISPILCELLYICSMMALWRWMAGVCNQWTGLDWTGLTFCTNCIHDT